MDVTTETFQRDVIVRSHEPPVVVDVWAAADFRPRERST